MLIVGGATDAARVYAFTLPNGPAAQNHCQDSIVGVAIEKGARDQARQQLQQRRPTAGLGRAGGDFLTRRPRSAGIMAPA